MRGSVGERRGKSVLGCEVGEGVKKCVGMWGRCGKVCWGVGRGVEGRALNDLNEL